MSIMTEDIRIKVEKITKSKKWQLNSEIKPIPYKWTLYEGKHIFTYGYSHTYKHGLRMAQKAFKEISKRLDRPL